jgi:glyoxylase I family protein
MNTSDTGSYIKQLEVELLSKDTRKDAERLNELLSDEFIEIGKSGKIYTKQAVIETLNNEGDFEAEIVSWKVTFLTDTIALAVYTVNLYRGENNMMQSSLRSSIWRSLGGRWQIIFHQGTLITN